MTALADMTDCELVRVAAFNIMEIRNREAPLDEMLRAFNRGEMKAITIRAYNRRAGLWTAAEFANEEMVRCTLSGR